MRSAPNEAAYELKEVLRTFIVDDAQIVTMGARVIGSELAKSIVRAFLSSEYQGGRSAPKVDRIKDYENGRA